MTAKPESWLGLEGKTCVVTGAAGGLGQAIAREFARDGANVALLDLDADACSTLEAEIIEAGGRAVTVACDVASDESVTAAVNGVDAAFGPADILVNNAGILRPSKLEDLSMADWQKLLDINLTGYLRCAQAFGKAMLARGEGAIVHIGSIAATQPQAFSGAYSPTKSAVVMLSRQMAYEWGPRGVRSNVVSPGLVRTGMSEAFYQVPGVLERRNAVVPTGRIGRPEDIADAAAYLASRRSAHVNGQDLIVDGGLSQTLMSFVPRPGYE